MKTVVISGASSGIGRLMVETFCEKGWNVLMIARDEKRLKQVQKENKNSQIIVCDLSVPKNFSNLKKKLSQVSVSALVNNAGIYQPDSVKDEDLYWDSHFQSNLMSAVRLTRLLWPSLKKNQGSIVNISSTLALRPIVNAASYSALKAAMNNWTLSLALEGAPDQINVNAICPGIIDTPIHKHVNSKKPKDIALHKLLQKAQPLGRTGQPQDIAPLAYHLCSPEAQWTTGAIINVDGGILLNS